MKKNKFIEMLIGMFLLAFCISAPVFGQFILFPTVSSINPNRGPISGGTQVTITGTNFFAGTTVRFGSNLGDVIFNSTTRIVAITPPGVQGPVDVTVSNPFTATVPNGFTYLSPPTVVAGDDQSGDEGDEVTVTANFSDNSGDTHIARIDWGDGTVTDGNIEYISIPIDFAAISIVFGTVTGSHAYGDNGLYTVTITVIDNYGASASDTLLVEIDNKAPRIANITNKVLKEGTPTLNLTFTFSDDGWLDTHTATIIWGDGDGVAIKLATSPLTRSHTYRGDDGQYSARVELSDDDGGNDEDSFTVTVQNENPIIAPIDDQNANEGTPIVSLRIPFTDPGLLDTHKATINWGDDTMDTINPATSPIAARHAYATKDNAQYVASVTVIDDNNGSSTEEFRVNINNENPEIEPIDDQVIEECDPTVNLVILFKDPGLQDEHRITIGWGDEKRDIVDRITSPFTISHTYDIKDDAQYEVGIAIGDYDGGSATESLVVTVENENPIIQTDLADKEVTECDSTVDIRASFTDCGPQDTHTSMIDWGDGMVEPGDLTEAVVSDAVRGTVVGRHRYDETGAGTYKVTVTVLDNNGGTGSKSFIVNVINEDPVIQTELDDLSVGECDPTVDIEVGYTDCADLNSRTATINWGDSVVEEAEVTEAIIAGTISGKITGSHTYEAIGNAVYTVTVTVADDNGGSDSTSFTVTIENEAPVMQADLADRTISECDPTLEVQANFTDCGVLNSRRARIDWGDDVVEEAEIAEIVVEGGISGTITGSHTYENTTGNTDYTVTVTVEDDGGGSDSASFDVVIEDEAPVIQTDLADIAVGECDPVVDLQVSFTDCGSLDTHIATINWGDENEDTIDPAISPVSANHTYFIDNATDNETYVVTVTVVDDSGKQDSRSFAVAIENEDPVIQTEFSDLTISECDPVVDLQASFTDCGLDSHTATISWGDGQETPGNVIEGADDSGVSGTVTGSHTYDRDDATGDEAYLVTVTVEDDNGGNNSKSFTVSVENEAPVIQTQFQDQTVVESNPTVNLDMNFDDCGSLDTHVVVINWGDGKENTINPAVSPINTVHTYVGDDGVYTVVVTVTDDNGGKDSESFGVTVNNENPTIADIDDQNILGSDPSLDLSVAFSDPGALDTHSMTINWGDGATDSIDPAISPELISHTYSGDSAKYEASIVLRDDDGGEDTESFLVTVANLAPIIGALSDQSIPESQPTINLVATFVDQTENDTHRAQIDWGDGETETIDPVTSPITSAHTYPGDDGQYRVSVTVTDKDNGSDTKSFMVTVTNEAPVVDPVSDQNLSEGDPVYTLNATFADPGLLDTHIATINWGDGKTDTVDPATSPISMEHTYPGDDGEYEASITVTDKDGGEGMQSFGVIIDNENPVIDPVSDQSVLEGDPTVEVNISFSDPGVLDTHTATIDWGDDNVSNINPAVNPITITHTYIGDDGQYDVSISLQDDDGGTATGFFTVTVDNEDPIIDILADQSIPEDDPTVSFNFGFTDPGLLDTHIATINWGDGSVDTVDPAIAPIAIMHTYSEDIVEHTVSITVVDDDGGSSEGSFIVTKINENPFINAIDDQNVDEGNPVVNLSISFVEAATGLPVWSQSGLVSFVPSAVNDGVLDAPAFNTDTSAPGSWLQLDTGINTKQDFVKLEITALSNPVNATWDIQYSDSGSEWVPVISDVGGHPFGPGTFTYEWSSVGAHRYWRLYKTDAAGRGGYHSEVQFLNESNTPPENIHIAEIAWGDGANDSINPAISPINVEHTYPRDNGSYTATVNIVHSGGGMYSRSFNVTVDNVAPVVNAGDDKTADKEETVNINASFTDAGLLDTHTATINWGDDSGDESASLQENNGSGTVTASHSYVKSGNYTVTVSVVDDDAATGQDDLIVDVLPGAAPVVTSISPSSGPTAGGTAVTITGQNFQVGNNTTAVILPSTVRIGNAPATNVQVISTRQINAVTPPGSAGTADVTVSNPGELSGTLRNGFTYIGPVSRITISPGTATVQVGQTRQFSVSGVDSVGTPVTVTNTDVNWTVADAGVGNISASGLFTAADVGGTNITAVLKSNSAIRATASVDVPDTEAPTVLSGEIFPETEDLNVPVTSSIPITFSEPIDLGSIEAGGMRVTGKDNRNIDGEFQFDPNSGLLTFTPSEPFKDEETIEVVVTTAVTDLAGNRLLAEFHASFTTGIGLRPGDTNNDGLVNTEDIIPLGQYWNLTGIPRDGASSDWEIQPAVPWEPERMATYADANGDGVVNEEDVIPIAANWNLTHSPNSLSPPQTAGEKSIPENSEMIVIYNAMYNVLDSVPIETEGVRALKAVLRERIANIKRQLYPRESKLLQNYPNPFNPETWIPYQLAEDASVRINIYNLSGRLVRTIEIGQTPAGYYHSKEKAAHWDGRNQVGERVSSGIYFYHLKAGTFESIKKLIIVQ